MSTLDRDDDILFDNDEYNQFYAAYENASPEVIDKVLLESWKEGMRWVNEHSSRKVAEVWHTPHIQELIGYVARVSNPSNQLNFDSAPKLLKYCIKNHHWSVFEQGELCVRIVTSRAIAAQILRHRNATFQEFSQRYAKVQSYEPFELRRQDAKNRQNSTNDLPEKTNKLFSTLAKWYIDLGFWLYDEMIKAGIAKESARFILPLASTTTLYMKGNIRFWIHYVQVRYFGEGVQKEHKDIAYEIMQILWDIVPDVCEALEWPRK